MLTQQQTGSVSLMQVIQGYARWTLKFHHPGNHSILRESPRLDPRAFRNLNLHATTKEWPIDFFPKAKS